MLINNAEENTKAGRPAAERATCALCMKDLTFPRIQLPDGEGGVDVYHPVCAAKLAASINRDLEKLLKSVIL